MNILGFLPACLDRDADIGLPTASYTALIISAITKPEFSHTQLTYIANTLIAALIPNAAPIGSALLIRLAACSTLPCSFERKATL